MDDRLELNLIVTGTYQIVIAALVLVFMLPVAPPLVPRPRQRGSPWGPVSRSVTALRLPRP